MSKSLNEVTLIGRLTKDPTVKYTPAGVAVANLGLATNESYKDKNSGQLVEKTEFHDIVFWQRSAEICGEYLKKGSSIFVRGKLQTRKYTAKDGQEKRVTEVVGQELIMLDSKPQSSEPTVQPVEDSESVPF